jgi:SAM-dependent methyltransferase
MTSNPLIKVFGSSIPLISGDTLVLDRWQWLKKTLPVVSATESVELLDVGCGSGAFTINSALRGYKALGLSWDERNQKVAEERASICKADLASFQICDVRDLDKESHLKNRFQYVVNTENIEHIINDVKLMNDIHDCLLDNGILLLTTPNKDFIPMWGDSRIIPDPPIEDGNHVRLGYTKQDCYDICEKTGFKVIKVEYCSGFLSQKITSLFRILTKMNQALGWGIVLPLRVLPPLFDRFIPYTGYSICLIAQKMPKK